MQYFTLLTIVFYRLPEISFCENQWDRSMICMFRQQMLRWKFFWPTQKTGEMISLHFGRIENELCFEG
jgi:hypothetical protein